MEGSFTDEEIYQPSSSSARGDSAAGHHLHQAEEVIGGGRSREMEVGKASSTNINVAMEDVAQNFRRRSLAEAENRLPPSRSLPAERSTHLLNMESAASCDHATKLRPNQPTIHRQRRSTSSPTSSSSYGAGYGLTKAGRLITSARDDEAMMRAMLAVLSSSTSPATDKQPGPVADVWPHGGTTAFEPCAVGYTDRRAKVGRRGGPSIHGSREAGAAMSVQEAAPTTTNQLHHMMSERKRREKLNESFQDLRSELQPANRKDKASLLASAKDQLVHLQAQISDLERENRHLEASLPPSTGVEDRGVETEAPIGRSVRVETRNAASTSTTSKRIGRITATAECDISDLAVCILGRLKEMGEVVALESMVVKYISSRSTKSRACTLTLEFQMARAVEEGDWDDVVLTEAIAGAVEEAETRS